MGGRGQWTENFNGTQNVKPRILIHRRGNLVNHN